MLVQTAEKPPASAGAARAGAHRSALPPPRTANRSALHRIVHLVADLDRAYALFADVLGGEQVESGDEPLGRYRELCWPGGGRIRLTLPAAGDPSAWLGTRPGRIHHLELHCPNPSGVRGARRIDADTHEIAPEHNLGTRLRLRYADPGSPILLPG